MLFARTLLTAAVIACVSLALVACGTDAPDTPTPAPVPTATAVPTATPAAADGVASGGETPEPLPGVPSVPHRGYNSLGDADAPIVMFDYSDFV